MPIEHHVTYERIPEKLRQYVFRIKTTMDLQLPAQKNIDAHHKFMREVRGWCHDNLSVYIPGHEEQRRNWRIGSDKVEIADPNEAFNFRLRWC